MVNDMKQGPQFPDDAARSRAVARDLIRLAEHCFPRSVITSGQHDDWNVTGPALVARCTRLMQAIMALPRAHDSAAAVLLRVLYEHLVIFAWLASSPVENLKILVAHDRREKLKPDSEMERIGRAPILSTEKRAEYEMVTGSAGPWPGIYNMAAGLGAYWSPRVPEFESAGPYSLFAMYTVLYRQMSWFTHGGVESLRRVTRAGTAARECIVHLDEQLEGPSNAVGSARIVYALCLLVSSHVFNFPNRDAIHAAFDRNDDG
jgi:hypothetical protein